MLLAVSALSSLRGQERQDPQRPPTFRTGTNIIRVDATVTDRSGKPLTNLTADDFEVREDGKIQAIASFKFIAADGQPTDDRSLAIRGPAHAAVEAAREDVRTFLIFWDEYHIEPHISALRGREALTKAVLDQFGPTDLVGLMDPLTPISAIEFTRDRRTLADRVHRLKGRMGEYVPARSAVEEAHLSVARRPGEIEHLRTQVSVTAIKAAAAHLGTLSPGRKTLIVVTESLVGRPGSGLAAPMPVGMRQFALSPNDLDNMAIDIVRAANDSNTVVHVVDPRGLQVNSSIFGGPLETLASGTGGDLVRSNDIPAAFGAMVRQVSALYLLGYSREMPLDGRFHEIKVRVKRGGVDVRARAGYWAPRAEDVEAAKRRAAAAVAPPAVDEAFSSLSAPNSPRLVEIWTGIQPLGDGRTRVTLAWTRRTDRTDAATPASVSATIKSAGAEPFDVTVDAAGTAFETTAGALQVALTVKDPSGEVLDRETRTVNLAERSGAALTLATPVLSRSRSPSELRVILAADAPPVHAGRVFTRTDRLIVRTTAWGPAAQAARVTARLIDRRGATLMQLPVHARSTGERHQVDLPLTTIAAGEFAIAFDATSGDAHAEAIVPFRVVR